MRRIEPLGTELTDRGERVTFDRWLAALPEDALAGNARFLVFRAWTLFYAGQIVAAAQLGEVAALLAA